MGRPRKKKILYVVFDTNAIFTSSDEEIVSATTRSIIADHSDHGDLEIAWILPHIVRAEREYQMRKNFVPYVQTSQRIVKLLSEDWDVSIDRVAAAISANIDRQLQDLNIQVIHPKVDEVDWNNVIDAAAFRQPPFEPGQKEKGFRDAIVCETFLQIAATLTGKDTAVLITDDRLATQYVKQRLPSARVLSDLNALREEITLRVSRVDAETAAEIERKAALLFLQKDNPNTLWFKKDIYNLIWSNDALSLIIKSVPIGASWEFVSHALDNPRLVKKEANRVYFQIDYIVFGKSRVWIPNTTQPPADLAGTKQHPAGLFGLGAAFPADASTITSDGRTNQLVPLNGLLGSNAGNYLDTVLPPVTVEIRWSATYNRRKALTHAEINGFSIQQPRSGTSGEPPTDPSSGRTVSVTA